MPVHIAFLGCGFITGVHGRHLKALRDDVVRSYASRDGSKAQACCRRYRGAGSYDSYTAAIEDPAVDAVVVAVPPRFHLDLTLQALSAGKHVLVEKPAYLRMEDYLRVQSAREGAGRVVLVGENDHYKPVVCEPVRPVQPSVRWWRCPSQLDRAQPRLRDTAFGGHLANLPANHRIPNFAGYHKPTFKGVFILLCFLNLFDG